MKIVLGILIGIVATLAILFVSHDQIEAMIQQPSKDNLAKGTYLALNPKDEFTSNVEMEVELWTRYGALTKADVYEIAAALVQKIHNGEYDLSVNGPYSWENFHYTLRFQCETESNRRKGLKPPEPHKVYDY